MRRAARHSLIVGTVFVASIRHRAAYAPPPRQMHKPAGHRGEKYIWQTHTADDTDRYDIDTREAHALLGTEPNDTLMRIKLNYLLRCRMFHPDAGGNAAMFYKITVAYERILFDRGVESRHGRINYTNVLSKRVRFDETPLIPEEVTEEEQALLSDGAEVGTNGRPVAWAKKSKQWRDVVNAEQKKQYDAEVQRKREEKAIKRREAIARGEEFDDDEDEDAPKELTALEKDALLSRGDHEAQAYGFEKAAVFLARKKEEDAREEQHRLLEESQKQLQAGAAAAAAAASGGAAAGSEEGSVAAALTTSGNAAFGPGGAVVETKTADPRGSALQKAEEVTEVDAATHPDDGLVFVKPPRKALFNQKPLSQWTDEQLMKRWLTAGEKLTHDEEESTARELIERSINSTGGQLSRHQKDFMMDHLVHRSESVAGEAARAATDVMIHTEERKTVMREGLVLAVLLVTALTGVIVVGIVYRHQKMREMENPYMKESMSMDTLLPWWGNDAEYERQVKRIFVDEWRKARQSARRVQTFQEGVARESETFHARETLDSSVFDVTSERLKQLRNKAERRVDPEESKAVTSEFIFEAREPQEA